MKNRIFSRSAESAFEAEQLAKCMLDAGCGVISIAFGGMRHKPMGDFPGFVVFGRANRREQIDAADEAWSAWLNSLTKQEQQ